MNEWVGGTLSFVSITQPTPASIGQGDLVPGGEMYLLLWGLGVISEAKQSLPHSVQREPPEGWSRVDGNATGRPQNGTPRLAPPSSQHPRSGRTSSAEGQGQRPMGEPLGNPTADGREELKGRLFGAQQKGVHGAVRNSESSSLASYVCSPLPAFLCYSRYSVPSTGPEQPAASCCSA